MPWPDRRLHPNARLHYWALSKIKPKVRAAAKVATLEAIPAAARRELKVADRVAVRMTFVPPNRRKRDDDGVIASMKTARDGIADAIGVDDGKWVVEYVFAEEPVNGGQVIVELSPMTRPGVLL